LATSPTSIVRRAPELARWKIENETFLTIKKQGYRFELSYAHGKHGKCCLSSVLGGLMLLAFLVEQVQEGFCHVFPAIHERYQLRRLLLEELRGSFNSAMAPDL